MLCSCYSNMAPFKSVCFVLAVYFSLVVDARLGPLTVKNNCTLVWNLLNHYELFYIHLPARTVNQIIITMTLYDRVDPTVGKAITTTSIPLTFNPSRFTWFIVDGWDEKHVSWMTDMKDLALQKFDHNVIIVKWNSCIKYGQAAADTVTVGNEIGNVAYNLVSLTGLSRTNLYCVGFSLGAHICGYAGNTIQFGRITGLDPARPIFDGTKTGLYPASADMVDVIHTDIILAGSRQKRGHYDFYSNTGRRQKGCTNFVAEMPGCRTKRAYELFIASIKYDQNCFTSKKRFNQQTVCPMGWDATQCTVRGTYDFRSVYPIRPDQGYSVPGCVAR